MHVRALYALLFLFGLSQTPGLSDDLKVLPAQLELSGPLDRARVIVTRSTSEGLTQDVTHQVAYTIADNKVAEVSDEGIVTARSDGQTVLVVTLNQQTSTIPVSVTSCSTPDRSSFRHDVVPVLTKLGCNSGGCHGKAEGQAGFRLSVFGFDAPADHEALVKQNRGRRVNRVRPGASLLLGKATNRIPHGGGQRTETATVYYRTLEKWLSEGATFDDDSPALTSVEVQPAEAIMQVDGTRQVRVVAHFADNSIRDVSHLAEFQSNAEDVAAVTRDGQISGKGVPGEAAVLIRFLDKLAVCQVTLPRSGTKFIRPAENNFVDRLIWDKLERLGIQPSELSDDATFLRRVRLDTTGTLPSADEAERFIADSDPNKRAALIDRLLEREEYAVYQALRWSDVLRLDSNALGAESAVAFTRWLRQQFRNNRPYDDFVRDILTAKGSTRTEGPAALYLTLNKPTELGSSISQLFLGVRIECAECHHHPFEKWSQEDFYGFAGMFTGVSLKNLPGGAKAVTVKTGSDLKHPRTGQPVLARGLGQDLTAATNAADNREADRRALLANWLTSADNPFFARSIVNRVWATYFERGLVDPVDDLRATNPASNEPLLAALTTHFQQHNFDLKELTRIILNSRTYQLSSVRNSTNADDHQNFSSAAFRPLPAEVLLDAISTATGVAEKFNGWPVGARAIEVWDNRMPSYFFRIFGRPTRTTVCSCERGDSPSISQALHLLNSPEISAKIQHRHGTARHLANSRQPPSEIVNRLYLTTLSRLPNDQERDLMLKTFSGSESRQEAVEDLLWTLMNTKEFLFNH